ncbi:MAG TPA: lytic transglycosylase domain-containing protein [Paraburkholderia sp.]|uniref:lytic transglycosylase domain-containing protein n=1 Tax=Paraburkholderia sp. TaxID=1926495 RepID=UPI002CB2EE97|nr:lytic transglycosylase domain-containing protein [Paraburkholderia sp.]HTR06256.1 lytic transglycosylase domain-containing protein [Paraburkholderia sp.]
MHQYKSISLRAVRTWALCGWAALLGLTTLGSTAVHAEPQANDCFDKAGAYQGVNPLILRAVAWRESKGDATAINRNANGSIDVGQLQINSIHFPELTRQGIPHRALTDPCVNIFVAAWLLKQKMVRYGNTWRAIGAYHSESPHERDAYARSIQAILVSWGQLQPSQ